MLTSGQQERKSKQRKIRNSEYYDMEGTFDRLYAESKKDKTFNHLMEIIESEENIKLAYRTIKKNTGSDTSGVDKRTIADLAKLSEEEYVRLIRKQFSNYHPRPVRRVEIPKPNGKTRPLGIPTIVDRIVQQCILQVMEPICEAKFSENSNGFRPNRSAETAIAQCMRLIQVQHLYHVVDLDIKGFFDNISHTKLMRQIWALGIRDKKLLCIIKEMLKAPVVLPNGEKTYPTRGTPQGGILSPLLANIVLNELDWWIASQWEQMPTKTKFKTRSNAQGTEIKSHAYRALRRSRLKEMHAVRYADDFKIFCATHEDAVRAYKATELWLKDRLGLEISPDKSKVVNLKRQYSDFLGFKLKVRKKGKKYVVRSHMSDKAYKKAHDKVSEEVKELAHSSDDNVQFMQLGEDGHPKLEEVEVVIPRFRPSTVFAYEQTEGEPLPFLVPEELTASVENYEIFMEAITRVSTVPIRFDEITNGAKGYYSNATKEIVINKGMSESQTMKTAIHECAHSLLHDKDIMMSNHVDKDRMTKEIEALYSAFQNVNHFKEC